MNEKAQAIAALLAEMEAEIDTLRQQVKAAYIEGMREALGRLKQAFSREAAINDIAAEIAALERGKESGK